MPFHPLPGAGRMSIVVSEGEPDLSGEDDLSTLVPTRWSAVLDTDPEMMAMLARVAESVLLEWKPPSRPEPSLLDDWYLGVACAGSQGTPVTFFPDVHDELTGTWTAPFTDRNRSSGTSSLTTLDGVYGCPTGGACGGDAIVSQRCFHLAGQSVAPPPLLLCSHRSSLLRGSAVEPVAGQPPRPSRPPLRLVVSGRARGPETGDPEMDGAALREMVNAPLAPQEEGRVENFCFLFFRHWPLAQKLDKRAVSSISGSPERGRGHGSGQPRTSLTSLASEQQWAFGECYQTYYCPNADTDTLTPLRTGNETPERGPCIPHRCPTGGTSVVLLVPLSFPVRLAGFSGPSDSAMRFSSPGAPPKFRGIHFTSVKAADAPVLRAEIATLLVKDAIEPVPPADMRMGFYSPYFIVPKKGGGLRLILDLRVLNRALHRLPFKILTQKHIFRCVTISAVRVRRASISVQGLALRAVVHTDASSTGWGATYNGQAVSGVWTGPQLHWHISCLELLAVRLALILLKGRLRGKHVLVHMDNTATVAYINRQGGLRSRRMSQLARFLLLWSQKHLRSLRAIHIPGLHNHAADELSRAALPGEWRLGESPVHETCLRLEVEPHGLERRLSPSTLKVYVAAISAHHNPIEGKSVGKHDLVIRFLRGARRLNLPRPPSGPSWDLSLVLTALRQAPFEPLHSVELKFLSMKTLLLLGLHQEGRGPGPGVELALLCPVRALRLYVDRTQSFRTSDQLFVCFGGRQKGNAVSKQRMAHWIVDAITLAYQAQGVPCPLRLRAHSTRSVASSWALARGASLTDICRAAG
ncbi:ORF V: Enzymatic polyprotein [Labeo rohita]|uniref:ORF V: Enzymatic polyprotein n=1 Tax=Labeo rohita TaxID=84645 RepID=A0ABQ8M1D2_LABRO|nr:ORF V: Enzymatic polyprotein [Labeo rohita]